ncbi:hypothetical protein AMTR_s00002p00207900 [Amborella trichopoda]|uniref:Uncharacterized protein n=1 Tax=Amborella trichopoda TaxID=13333 RepID=W1P0I5_AMBTC|nr:hypothetical protein AMTR_s00002p00207900 [Amborella trichopoda]
MMKARAMRKMMAMRTARLRREMMKATLRREMMKATLRREMKREQKAEITIAEACKFKLCQPYRRIQGGIQDHKEMFSYFEATISSS